MHSITIYYIVTCSVEISNIVQCTTHMLHLACWANHDAHTAVIHAQLITQQKLIKLRDLESHILLLMDWLWQCRWSPLIATSSYAVPFVIVSITVIYVLVWSRENRVANHVFLLKKTFLVWSPHNNYLEKPAGNSISPHFRCTTMFPWILSALELFPCGLSGLSWMNCPWIVPAPCTCVSIVVGVAQCSICSEALELLHTYLWPMIAQLYSTAKLVGFIMIITFVRAKSIKSEWAWKCSSINSTGPCFVSVFKLNLHVSPCTLKIILPAGSIQGTMVYMCI